MGVTFPAPVVVSLALLFGPVEYFSLMVLAFTALFGPRLYHLIRTWRVRARTTCPATPDQRGIR